MDHAIDKMNKALQKKEQNHNNHYKSRKVFYTNFIVDDENEPEPRKRSSRLSNTRNSLIIAHKNAYSILENIGLS